MKSLADKLKPIVKDGLVRVIIETPSGSRNFVSDSWNSR